MPQFKKLNTKRFQKSKSEITPDQVYWKKLGPPVLIKEFGPIDYIDFSPIDPYYFAVTCSVRVQIYNPITKLVVKNLSRFRENAYGATFRQDGKLLCSGGEETVVKLFDVSSKSLLRLFKGHTASIHRTFFVSNNPQIVSFSDDKTVKLWDIPTEKDILTFNKHTDYVRAGAINPLVPNIILSGGYDNMVTMFDTRINEAALQVNHGSPIESLLFLPSSGMFLSAGGTDIKVWDAIAGGKLLANITQHHKTVTSLRLASNGKRILSGSLDKHVNIYDVSSFKKIHSLEYPNSVLSLGLSKNDDIVAGLIDGLVCVNKREEEVVNKSPLISHKYATNTNVTINSVVKVCKQETLAKHEICLRKFQYSKALSYVLMPYVVNKSPEVTISLMQELLKRKALTRVFKDSDNKSISQILRFFIRYITDYRFTKSLIILINKFLNVYESKLHLFSLDIVLQMINLNKLLMQELKLATNLGMLQGSMSMIMISSNVENEFKEVFENLVASSDAQKNLTLTLN